MKPHEAQSARDALTEAELEQLHAVEEQWPKVMERDGKITCRALRAAVNFEMRMVDHYMHILHGLAQTDKAAPAEPEHRQPEPTAPGITKLTDELRKLAYSIDQVSQETITTRTHEATQRAHGATEAQIKAAEAKSAEMSAQLDDLEYTKNEVISEAIALATRVGGLTAESARALAEREEASAKVSAMTIAKTLAEQQRASLRTEIADVRAANTSLIETLAEVRRERDAYRQGRDDYEQTANLVPGLRVEVATFKTQIEGRINEAQLFRSTIQRMTDELTQVRQDHLRNQKDAQETITELRRLLSTFTKSTVDA
jgi:chromosome segregation ATPase